MSAVDPNGAGATLVPGAGLSNPMSALGDLITAHRARPGSRGGRRGRGAHGDGRGAGMGGARGPRRPSPSLAGPVSTVLGADTVAGYGYVDPTGLASLTLAAVGQVVSGVTGTLDLYDLTAVAVVATGDVDPDRRHAQDRLGDGAGDGAPVRAARPQERRRRHRLRPVFRSQHHRELTTMATTTHVSTPATGAVAIFELITLLLAAGWRVTRWSDATLHRRHRRTAQRQPLRQRRH